MYRTATLTVMAVIKPQLNQFALGTALTTFGELMEIHLSVSAKSQYCKELHMQIVAN
jgi:hypothetical protein